jgi:hypothetical protein
MDPSSPDACNEYADLISRSGMATPAIYNAAMRIMVTATDVPTRTQPMVRSRVGVGW